MVRLDKFLAEMGVGTRSQVKQLLKKGQISVNGEPEKRPERKIDPVEDWVSFQGQRIAYAEMEYYMLYKPAGYVSASRDSREKTVLDLLPDKKRKDLFPVGRLDKDTEGLLLITNDGALAHALLSPKKHVDKTYYARLARPLSEAGERHLEEGIDIGDEKPTLPAGLCVLDGDRTEVEITVHEGRFHQIKRMFEAVENQVTYLKRLSMGSLKLDPALKKGEYRPLTKEELKSLRRGFEG